MAYSLEKDLDKNIVKVTYDENTSYQNRIDLLDDLVEVMADHSDINILIDIRNAKQNMTPEQQIKYGELVASKQQYFNKSRTAVLSERSRNPHPYIIPKAHVGGYKGICEFHSENEAIQWLNGEIR